MNTKFFLRHLVCLGSMQHDSPWSSSVEDGCIHMRHARCDIIFVPLTAVYYDLTGIEIHRGSFWVEEMTRLNGFSRFELLRISHATFACNCDSIVGRGYCPKLRDNLLKAVGLP